MSNRRIQESYNQDTKDTALYSNMNQEQIGSTYSNELEEPWRTRNQN